MSMRRTLVVLHRWLGLFTALFLFLAGLTGAIIAWDHELDSWLNPSLFVAPRAGAPLSPLQLAQRLERADSRLMVTYTSLTIEPGHTALMSVKPRNDPKTGKAYELAFDQVALDPASGAIVDRRMWGVASLSRKSFLPFLYKLHYSLHLPHVAGLDSGMLLMGMVAVVWLLDAFVALWLSFPNLSAWRKSFAFRFRAGGYRLIFDLHRSGGVWIWPLFVVLAMTAVSMNLSRELVRPLVAAVSSLTPSPFDVRTPRPLDEPAEPGVTREWVLARAIQVARQRGVDAPAGGIFYSPTFDAWGVGFYEAGNEHGDGSLGNPWFYFDGQSGADAGGEIPGQGSAGDVFLQLQFPLHSGRLGGVLGRALVSLLGLMIATLSVTGVVIWARKRRARAQSAARATLTAEGVLSASAP
jgi:uncharacterized iron-regulated membrane protein